MPQSTVHPEAQARLQQAHARRALGAAISDRLRAAGGAPGGKKPLGTWAICAALAASSGAVVLLLAAFGANGPMAWAGAGLLGASAGCTWRWRRQVRLTELPDAPLFDPQTLRALDQVLDKAAPELPEAALVQLRAVKEALVRVAKQASQISVDEHFTLQDRLYVSACGQRYLPDTLSAYLAVPKAQREAALSEGGQSAAALLGDQLALLLAEIEAREAGLARSAAEGLQRQKRFLAAKAAER